MAEADVRTVRSFCRICTAVCGILVDVEGDTVVRVRGDKDHPMSHGYTCPKGRALPAIHHHPDRIERPMMRVDGALRPTTWEACLDDLGERLRAIIDRHGPESVGVYFGSGLGMDAAGYKMVEALHGAIGTPAKFSPLTIDGTAKTLVSHLVGGFPGFTSHIDYERASMVLYIGVNPVVSHGHNIALSDPVSAIRAVRSHAEVWVLDPRTTETARLANRHLAPRPGTDYAVLAYVIRELLKDGADREVVEHRCVGGADLAAALEPFDRRYAADLAGLPEADLDELLAAVRRAGPIAIHTGTGVTMPGIAGNVTAWLAWVLMIVTGAMNRPGRRVVPSRVQPPVRLVRAARPPTRRPLRARAALASGRAGLPRGVAVRGAVRRDRGRQHPRLPQPRRAACSPRSPTPTGSSRRCGRSRCSPTEIIANPRPPSPPTCCPPRTNSSGPT